MKILPIAAVLAALPLRLLADGSLSIPMNFVNETATGASAGTITVTESAYGLVFTPALTGLPAGLHGFHVHENPSCLSGEKDGKKVAALGAGAHLDPQKTGQHGYPWGDGHLGDLPPLYVGGDGVANQPVLGPRLKLADLKGRSLMIHAGGDNHADHPAPLGGGGARIVCGVVP
jgi:Cu-Zn family superoxide dismutase